MTKKPELSDLDKAAFQEAMKGVKRLAPSNKIASSPPSLPVKLRKKTQIESNNSDIFQFSDYDIYNSVGSGELIEFFRSGLQQKMMRKMRTGQYEIQAKLDLHGMIVIEAREALSQFILDCQRRGIRQVLIIHGKGRANQVPILKNKLNHWLRQTSDILAFSSAKSKEGGTGALYVLLTGLK